MASDLEELRVLLQRFAEPREWSRFHTPRNLVLALVGEVGELAAELQWVDDEQVEKVLQSRDSKGRLEDEVADVLLYLVRLADVCGIDLARAARNKLQRNEQRYPVGLARGSAQKYSTLLEPDAFTDGTKGS